MVTNNGLGRPRNYGSRPRAKNNPGNLRQNKRKGYFLKFITNNLKPIDHIGKLTKQLLSPFSDKPGPSEK